jgi:hypothetical protein
MKYQIKKGHFDMKYTKNISIRNTQGAFRYEIYKGYSDMKYIMKQLAGKENNKKRGNLKSPLETLTHLSKKERTCRHGI